MGRMDEALRKAAEERERKRRQRTGSAEVPVSAPAAGETEVVTATGRILEPAATPARPSEPRSRVQRALDGDRGHADVTAAFGPPDTGLTTGRRLQPALDARLVCFHSPKDPRAEQIRRIRTSLLCMDPVPRSVAITSGSPDEGKSLTCANLAASMAESGRRRVLLVDANLRFPQLATIVGASEGAGLSELMGGLSGDPEPLIQVTAIPGVRILSAGRVLENPGSLLNPTALAGILGLVEENYDFVIVDTPALDEFADAAVLAPETDGTILVCAVDGPPRSNAEKALELLQASRARVLGVVATNCR